MVWTYLENGRGCENKLWYPVAREERMGRPKTTCMDEICGMMGEMGLTGEEGRDRENLR